MSSHRPQCCCANWVRANFAVTPSMVAVDYYDWDALRASLNSRTVFSPRPESPMFPDHPRLNPIGRSLYEHVRSGSMVKPTRLNSLVLRGIPSRITLRDVYEFLTLFSMVFDVFPDPLSSTHDVVAIFMLNLSHHILADLTNVITKDFVDSRNDPSLFTSMPFPTLPSRSFGSRFFVTTTASIMGVFYVRTHAWLRPEMVLCLHPPCVVLCTVGHANVILVFSRHPIVPTVSPYWETLKIKNRIIMS